LQEKGGVPVSASGSGQIDRAKGYVGGLTEYRLRCCHGHVTVPDPSPAARERKGRRKGWSFVRAVELAKPRTHFCVVWSALFAAMLLQTTLRSGVLEAYEGKSAKPRTYGGRQSHRWQIFRLLP